MTRGQSAPDGATRVSANGYMYTKVDGTWRFTHHIIAEKKLGRALRPNERVSFGDKGKTCFEESNIIITQQGKASARRRIAILEARIEEIQAEIKLLQKEVEVK